MKKLFLLLLVTIGFCSEQVLAQANIPQGVITYDLSLHLKVMVAKQEPAMAKMVPDELHMNVMVTFKKELFSILMTKGKNKPSAILDMLYPSLGLAEGKTFVNLKTGMARQEDIFNKKTFYTENKMSAAKINYTNEVKTILGYKCYKATVTDEDKSKIIVWYTTAFPVAYSPEAETFYGIKGTVLEFQREEATCTAVAINLKPPVGSSVAYTANAKKITKEQMQDLTDERNTERENDLKKSIQSSGKVLK